MKYILILITLIGLAFGQQGFTSNIYGEANSDTTLIAVTMYYGEEVNKIRYYFDREDYNKASQFIQMEQFGFNRLNVSAKQDYLELINVIKKIEGIEQ